MPKKKLLGLPLPVFIIGVILFMLILISLLGGPIGSKLLGGIRRQTSPPGWASVQTPKPELPAEALFHIGSLPVTNTLLTTWITIVILLLVCHSCRPAR